MSRLSLAFAFAVLTMIGATNAVAQAPPDTIMIDPGADAGRSLEARVGMVLSLGLPNNAGTGYFWRVVADRNALTIGAPRTVRTNPGGPEVGFPTTEIVTVRPRRAGPSEIRFVLARPGGEAARDVRIRIDAR